MEKTILAVYNGIVYWEGTKNNFNDEEIRILVQDVAEEDGFYIDTDEVKFYTQEEWEKLEEE